MEELNQDLSSLVRFGVSEQLIQALRAIEESSDEHGRILYQQSAIYEMRCAILCRNYAKALWEFSHFIAVIEHQSEQGAIAFFWDQQILNSTRFRQWLMESVNASGYILEEQGVFKGQIGKREFIFNPKRINLMAAWTAFLVMIDPALLNTLSEFRQQLSEKRIDECARQLKAALDRYLEPHLQAIHQQRQGRALLSWLQAQASSAESDTLLTDASVLDFWQHNAPADEGDFKRFSTVADCAYRLHEAICLSEGQQQIEAARSYHQDQWGDSAEWLIDEVSQVDSGENLFEQLLTREPTNSVESLGQTALKDIKFLTAKDAAFCEKFELAGDALWTLPLTFLRAQVFGLQQARITEDLRASKGQHLPELISMADFSGFELWCEGLKEQLGRISQTRAAVTYILYQFAHPLALARLLEGLSLEQKGQLTQLLGNQPATGFAQQVLTHLASLAPEEVKLLETAFSKVNRAGFKTLPAEVQVDRYLTGDECLAVLQTRLSQYAERLTRLTEIHGEMSDIEISDARIFSHTFAQLYLEQGETR